MSPYNNLAAQRHPASGQTPPAQASNGPGSAREGAGLSCCGGSGLALAGRGDAESADGLRPCACPAGDDGTAWGEPAPARRRPGPMPTLVLLMAAVWAAASVMALATLGVIELVRAISGVGQ